MANYILVHGIRIAKDFVPETFGRLTTIGPAFRMGQHPYQVCQCSCGTCKVLMRCNLLNQTTKSCGCLHKEATLTANTTHGNTIGEVTPEYRTWATMKQRCDSPNNKSYKNYGGRGIKVCDRWQIFENFIEDMGKRPSPTHSIDRINVNGDYCPENCRWATPEQQSRNRRNNHWVEFEGKTQTLVEWAEEYSIPYKTLHARVQDGWDFKEALTKEIRKGRLKQIAKEAGIPYKAFHHRLSRGWPMEKAINTPLRMRHSDEKEADSGT